MKFTNKKIVFTVTALFIVALMPFIQSCSNNNELESTEKTQTNVELTASEKTDIINSTEFKEFVDANIEIAVLMKSSKASKIEYDYSQVKNMLKKINTLNDRFPLTKKIGRDGMKNLMIDAILKSKSLKQKYLSKGFISTNKTNVRQKANATESTDLHFNDPADAFLFANIWAYCTQTECCGFVLENGAAVLFIDPNATKGSASTPGFQWGSQNGCLVALYSGSAITETFHVQFNSWNYSPEDIAAHELCFPNAKMTIFYNGSAYEYQFTNGTPHGNYDWMLVH